jgi:hypothetical protein
MPAEVLLNNFKKDIAFALRQGTIAQVTTALDLSSAPSRMSSWPSTDEQACWDR